MSFKFRAKEPAEAQQWVQALNEHILESKGYRRQSLAPLTRCFWKQEQISEEQFLLKANTFDILLFKCKHFAGKITRLATGSEFDHVAMIVKFAAEPDDVMFVEANNANGV